MKEWEKRKKMTEVQEMEVIKGKLQDIANLAKEGFITHGSR